MRKSLKLIGLAALLGACDRHGGSGEVKGLLFVQDCRLEGRTIASRGTITSLGSAKTPAPYDLRPRFFAGEPLEDPRKGRAVPENRLIVRLQTTGKRVEANDTLTIQFSNLFPVAKCIRGRMIRTANGELRPDYDTRMCSWGPDQQGPPRVRIGPDFPVQASLAPRTTCPSGSHVVGTAVGKDIDAKEIAAQPRDINPTSGDAGATVAPSSSANSSDLWESWLEFEAFGGARQGREPTDREPVNPAFRVDFGERITVSRFQMTLTDDLILKAEKRDEVPPEPEINGILIGNFDFNVERGQGYQAFP